MPDIYEIKNRIEGLKSIHNITYAMQIVTISRLKRITAQLGRMKSSFEEINQLAGYVLSENEKLSRAFFHQELDETKPPVLLMFFSNRGFCGSFNQDIVNKAIGWCQDNGFDYHATQKVCIGKKGALLVKDKDAVFFAPQKDLFSKDDGEALYQIVQGLMAQKRRLYSVFFEFKSIVSQKIVVEPFFPPSEEEFSQRNISLERGSPYFVEPNRTLLEEKVFEHYYYLKLFKGIRESASSEFSQRFLLMKSAVDNVKELSEELTMELNKERQRGITQEISEIISTFKALSVKK